MKYFLTFGDSWAWGSELAPDEKPFGKIIADYFDAEFIQGARPSSSIPDIVCQLRDTLLISDFSGSTALFFLTSPLRDIIWDHDGKKIDLSPSCTSDQVGWYKNISTHKLAEFRANTSLLATSQICQKYNIMDWYIWGWEKINLWPELDQKRFFGSSALEVLGGDPNRTFIEFKNSNSPYMKSGHPNQLGHQLIANKIIDWFKKS